jgi:hypothetical protein
MQLLIIHPPARHCVQDKGQQVGLYTENELYDMLQDLVSDISINLFRTV